MGAGIFRPDKKITAGDMTDSYFLCTSQTLYELIDFILNQCNQGDREY